MKILIIGSTGMLGNQIVKFIAKNPAFTIFATYKNLKKKNSLYKNQLRKNIIFKKFDILKSSDNFLKKLLLNKDIIINCSGLTKQNSKGHFFLKKTVIINTLFPLKLHKFAKKKQKIYQIATDGVFNGKTGRYKETDAHSLNNIYSATKSLGEIYKKNFYNIRCSIIGEELYSNNFLLSWFLSNNDYTKVTGYTNHIWNGVTTKVFAKILNTIIKDQIKIPNILHLIPKDKVSKYKLLKLIGILKKRKIKISKFKTKDSIDRTLDTNYKKLNLTLWKKTFLKQLTIKEMLTNFFEYEN